MANVQLSLTAVGYAAAMRAKRTGIRISIDRFAVADYDNDYTPDSSAVALLGTVLYSGPIEDVRANERGDRIYRCFVPDNSVSGNIYEFGLYLSTGELFAIGTITPRYEKTTVFQLRIYAYLRIPNVNERMDFEGALQPVVPTVNHYSDLPPANLSGANVYVVRNGHCALGLDGLTFAPVTVAKWKNGDEWSIVSGSCPYYGRIEKFDSANALWFTVDAAFDPTGMDFGMVTVTSGSGRYQTRHCIWNADLKRFDIHDVPFDEELDVNRGTTVRLWAGPGCFAGRCP